MTVSPRRISPAHHVIHISSKSQALELAVDPPLCFGILLLPWLGAMIFRKMAVAGVCGVGCDVPRGREGGREVIHEDSLGCYVIV